MNNLAFPSVAACKQVSICVLLSTVMFSWLWQAFRLYGFPGTILYYDEPGTLFHVPFFAGLTLVALGVASGRPAGQRMLAYCGLTSGRGWWVLVPLMWAPVLLMLPPMAFWLRGMEAAAGLVVSALTGVGAGLALSRLGLAFMGCTRGRLVWGIGCAGALIPMCNLLVLLCPEVYRLALALGFPLLFVVLSGLERGEQVAGVEQGADVSRQEAVFFWTACLLSAFSEGVYCNLDHALIPVIPRPSFDNLLLVVQGSLAALLALSRAHKSSIWYSFLLVIPVLVAGYTAWPLLHRESPGLSLGGLLFGYALLNVYMVVSLLYAVVLRRDVRLLYLSAGLLFLTFWGGSHNSPWIAERIATGSTINPLFAFLACALVVCSLLFVMYLDGRGFFRTELAEAPSGIPISSKPFSLTATSLEELEGHFREHGLTRQQAMIAGMLTLKIPDGVICDKLTISPSTLKTHIRNIHRRLGISSRHELAWLVSIRPGTSGDDPR